MRNVSSGQMVLLLAVCLGAFTVFFVIIMRSIINKILPGAEDTSIDDTYIYYPNFVIGPHLLIVDLHHACNFIFITTILCTVQRSLLAVFPGPAGS